MNAPGVLLLSLQLTRWKKNRGVAMCGRAHARRLEPLAVVVLAVGMAIAAVQICVRSVQRLFLGEFGDAPIQARCVNGFDLI